MREMNPEEIEREILENWDNPLSPISFLSTSKLYDHFNGILKRKQIEKLLSTFESYSLQKEQRSPGKRYQGFSLPTHANNILEIDSFQITELSDDNLGVAHILCGINTFTKRLFAIPLLKRDSQSGLEAIKHIFRLSKSLPQYIVSDQVYRFIHFKSFLFFIFFRVGNATPNLFGNISSLEGWPQLLWAVVIRRPALDECKERYKRGFIHISTSIKRDHLYIFWLILFTIIIQPDTQR